MRLAIPLGRIVGALLVQALAAFTGEGLQIDNYSAALHNRFANSPTFIAAGYNLSAVARSSDNRWGTLVGPNVFLSANHYHPGPDATLTFFATNDPAGPSAVRTVVAGERFGLSDIWIGILADPLPAEYQSMPFIGQTLLTQADFLASPIYLQNAFMVGRYDTGSTASTNVALGRNKIDLWWDQVTDAATDVAIGALRQSRGRDYVTYEAYLQLYDSGAPLLLDMGGTLAVLGFNWFINDPGTTEFSGFSYVGNYAAEVQAVIAAFATDITTGYRDWMATAFPAGTRLAPKGPATDFDKDGLPNFLEYAFCLNPASGAQASPASASVAQVAGVPHLQITFKAREDAQLQYFVRSGSDLAGWNEAGLAFSAGTWSSAQPATATVAAATSLGGGIWQLTVRATGPLAPGQPRFLAPGAR